MTQAQLKNPSVQHQKHETRTDKIDRRTRLFYKYESALLNTFFAPNSHLSLCEP